MSAKKQGLDYQTVKKLAEQGLTINQIAIRTGLSETWVRGFAKAKNITVRDGKVEIFSGIETLTDETIRTRVRELADEQGVTEYRVTTRKATPEELAEIETRCKQRRDNRK